MTPKAKQAVSLGAVVALLVAIVVTWHIAHTVRQPLKTTQTVGDFDQFQKDLAQRVLDKMNEGASGSDFSVIVATTAYPIGTLLRPTGSVPADFDDCAPAPAPSAFSAQRLFPSYTMSSNTALAANLGSRALQGLDSAGVNLEHSANVEYAIAETAIQMMDDKSVKTVTAKGDCGQYIASHPGTRLIRGAVVGKMTFTVKVDNPATVKAQLAKLGGFTITDNPQSSTLSIADTQSAPIVELLSQFGGGATPAASPVTPKPVEALSPSREPASVPAGTRIFIQQDAADAPQAGAMIVQIIHDGWPKANVENKVQKIPSQKMPDVAQVRFFNDSDDKIANRCVDILRKSYPNARLVRVGLASPGGQLEVWLPKAKSAAN